MSELLPPTLASILQELGEIKEMVRTLLAGSNMPHGAQSGGKIEQSGEVKRYIAEIIFPKLKAMGVQSKQEAERMLYGFCLVKKFEELTQAQAEAFYIHLQEHSGEPPGLWKLKATS